MLRRGCVRWSTRCNSLAKLVGSGAISVTANSANSASAIRAYSAGAHRASAYNNYRTFKSNGVISSIGSNRRWFGSASAPTRPPRSKWTYFFAITGCYWVCYVAWKWYTHHNYPPEVADKLREGLMAEINGAGYRKPDHYKALKAYIEALHMADEIKMSPISDEYTGIQLKIAEMYEKLGMEKEAAQLHAEIDNTYVVALLSKRVPEELRATVLKRDLRVAIMVALYLSTEPSRAAEMILLPHIRMALREAVKEDSALETFIKTPLKNLNLDFEGIKQGSLPKNLYGDAFEPFKEELFTMQEMSVGMQIASANYNNALLTKFKTTQLMLQSGFSLGECLLSATNLAALMYLSWATTVPYEASEDSQSESRGPKPIPLLEKLEDHPSLSAIQQNTDLLLQLADDTYEQVLTTIESLGGSARRSEFVSEAQAMALYGRGVIRTVCKDWSAASDFLNEARLRARGCEVESLMENADEEIDKVEKLSLQKDDTVDPAQLPDVNVIYWRMAPENWIKGQPIPTSQIN